MSKSGSRDNSTNLFVRLWWKIRFPSPPSHWFSGYLKLEYVFGPKGRDGMKHLKVERDDHSVYLTVIDDKAGTAITVEMTGKEARDAGDSLFTTGADVKDPVVKKPGQL